MISKRIPIWTKVAVRMLMSDEWEPAFVIGYGVTMGSSFAYHVRCVHRVGDRIVWDPDIVAVQFE